MWTSERSRRPLVREAAAETGEVTLGGGQAGVILGGERRWTALCCPGGYTWRPAAGDRVLVLKAGGEQESPFILGVETDGSDLAPGEVRLSGGSSTLRLGSGGLELNGNIQVNGMTLENYIKQVASSLLGGGGDSGGEEN